MLLENLRRGLLWLLDGLRTWVRGGPESAPLGQRKASPLGSAPAAAEQGPPSVETWTMPVERRIPEGEYKVLRDEIRRRIQAGERLWMAPPEMKHNPRIKALGGHWEDGKRKVPRGWVFETEAACAQALGEVAKQLPLPHVPTLPQGPSPIAEVLALPPEQRAARLQEEAGRWADLRQQLGRAA